MPNKPITRELQVLTDTPPWEWPEDTAELLLTTLRDEGASEADQLAAAGLAGDVTVTNDELVGVLLEILKIDRRSEKVRATAAIALGPVLESCDTEGFDDVDDPPPITQPTYRELQQVMRAVYENTDVPQLVRRRILEASVRAPEPWHAEAVRTAHASDDETWKLTAVFCMGYIRGFDDQILEALKNPNQEIQREAIYAAGNWELEGAWSHVAAVVKSPSAAKPLLLAAIEAVASIRPEDAAEQLEHLQDSEDEEIVEAVEEALAMAEASSFEDDA